MLHIVYKYIYSFIGTEWVEIAGHIVYSRFSGKPGNFRRNPKPESPHARGLGFGRDPTSILQIDGDHEEDINQIHLIFQDFIFEKCAILG